jgi:hypothetical protein
VVASLLAALLLVPLAGSASAAGVGAELKLEPAELTLANDSWGDRPKATVTLVGPGAAAFALANSAPRNVVLHDAGGHEARVVLEAFSSAGANLAEARLRLENDPPPGRYGGGEVTLFPHSSEAPRMKLTVASHRSFLLAIALVFLGVLVGVLAKALYALNARRDVLLAAVAEADDRVNEVSTGLDADVDVVARVTWYLDDLATARGQAAGANSPLGALSGVQALRARIAEARNDKDLEEDTGAVLEVVARIQRWLRLAPAAWLLERVAGEQSGAAAPWHAARTWRDTRLLQERLRYEPQGPAEADDLAARVLWQIRWHHLLFALHAAAAAPEHAAALQEIEALDATLPANSNVLTRTSAERDELAFKLEQLREKPALPQPADLQDMPVLSLAVGALPVGLEVNWQATPNLFTGWATLDGTTWLRVRARAVERSGRRRPQLRQPSSAEVVPALIWSLLPVIAASVVYAVTVYGETWGSTTDLATALAAGFAGKVTVDLATLPIFQSRRVLPPAKAPAGGSG